MVVVVLYAAAVVDSFPRAQRTSRAMLGVGPAFQLLEYQTDLRRCRFPQRYRPSSLLRPYIADTSTVAM